VNAESTVDHARRRNRSIFAFFATSITSRGLGIGCQLVQVPIALHYLGNEAFGLWVTLSSIGYMLTCADLGIGLGVQNKIAEAWGSNDQEGARRIFVTGFVSLSVLTLGILAVLVPVCRGNALTGYFHITDPALQMAVKPAILAVVAIWCLNIPLGLGQRLAYGAQLGWAHNAAATVWQVAALVAVWVGVWQKLGLVAFFFLTFATGAIVNVVFLVYLLRRLGWRRFSRHDFETKLLWDLAHLGIFFFLQQIANVVIFSAPPLMVSSTIGVAAVTPFNLVQRVLNLFTVVTNALMIPLWPAYAEAKARGDWNWIRRTLWRSSAMIIVLAVVPMILIGFWVPDVIRWWTHGVAARPSHSLVWLLVAWNGLFLLQQPFGFFLAGLSNVRRPTIYSLLSLVAILAAIHFLLPSRGVEAIPLGLIIGFLPFIFVGTVVETLVFLRLAPGKKTTMEASGSSPGTAAEASPSDEASSDPLATTGGPLSR
jgi:O-antigen/teichoic acid export membrane protein